MSEKIPHGTTARVLLALARAAHAKGTVMPTQEQIAQRIGRTPSAVYLVWRRLQAEGAVRARVEFVGQFRRVFVEEVRG